MEHTIETADPELADVAPSLAVVSRVAKREGVAPEALTPPLHSAIDPEALDSVCRSFSSEGPDSAGRISFSYCGYAVDVSSDGDVTVAES